MSKESWLLVKKFPYEVSTLGRIRRLTSKTCAKAGTLIKPSPGTRGYLRVSLCCDGRQWDVMVAILVCTIFHGPRPTRRHHAAHRNGIKTDNRASNLAWLTPKQNEADKVVHGVAIVGEKHPLAKLRTEDVLEIKRLLSSGVWRHHLIADAFGVSVGKIHQIACGISWKHIRI